MTDQCYKKLAGKGMRLDRDGGRERYVCVKCGLVVLEISRVPGESLEFGEGFPEKCDCGNELTVRRTVVKVWPLVSEWKVR